MPALALTAAVACGAPKKERVTIPLDQTSSLDHVSYYLIRNYCGHPNDDQAPAMKTALESVGIKTVLDLKKNESRLGGAWANGIQEMTGIIVVDAPNLPVCPPVEINPTVVPTVTAPPSASLVPPAIASFIPPLASSPPSIIPPPVKSTPSTNGSKTPPKEIRCPLGQIVVGGKCQDN
ncbi:MAG: hypothetical protein KKC80_03845 [Candidatus Margulisbacteria bacterium]|nr:hypothetical protein [Candidatus Margulisiibacteriota bacterium]MBU1617401.1 hypothetical protein [Candidatus Margulisiibacteriota bacterium]